MIERSRDLERINRLLARDFPGCDFSEVLAEPMHICLVEDENGAIFAFRGPGVYEVHVFFSVRGREAAALIHGMLGHMRAEYGARLFWALIPLNDRKTRMFARLVGWKSLGTRETRNGPQELFASET
jgi:hypothetical protein